MQCITVGSDRAGNITFLALAVQFGFKHVEPVFAHGVPSGTCPGAESRNENVEPKKTRKIKKKKKKAHPVSRRSKRTRAVSVAFTGKPHGSWMKPHILWVGGWEGGGISSPLLY